MRHAAAASPPTEDSSPPKVAAASVRAERLAREIVFNAREEADRVLAAARDEAAARAAELIAATRAELGKIPLPPEPGVGAARVLVEAAARCAEILGKASARAAQALRAAEKEATAIEARTRRGRAASEKELQKLVVERNEAVRALEARVARVKEAGTLASDRPRRRRPSGRVPMAIALVGVAALAATGTWAFTHGSPKALLSDPPVAKTGPTGLCPIPSRFRSAFVAASQREQVPLSLLTAVASVESHWRPGAVSAGGAVGLLQIEPSTAATFHVNPYIWRQNVVGAARFLRQLLSRYRGNTELALAAYNSGPNRVSQGTVPLETVDYVGAVMAQQAATIGCR